ncbi:unnamed protein product [Dicrocoelium dendriticum]|nr:unnamed protein product [Dicrocoelium dendriticum]
MLSQVADQLGEVHYQSNEYVIRQGARGDNLFIITQGKVDVTIYETGSDGEIRTEMQPRFVRTLKRGEWFGEKALNGDHKRTANIIAAEPEGATCLTLDYESYKFLIGDLTSLERRYSDFKIRNDALVHLKRRAE